VQCDFIGKLFSDILFVWSFSPSPPRTIIFEGGIRRSRTLSQISLSDVWGLQGTRSLKPGRALYFRATRSLKPGRALYFQGTQRLGLFPAGGLQGIRSLDTWPCPVFSGHAKPIEPVSEPLSSREHFPAGFFRARKA
jgi:hypothetical protein